MASKKKREIVQLLKSRTGSKMERIAQVWQEWTRCRRCELGNHREMAYQAVMQERNNWSSADLPPSDIVLGEGNPDAPIMIIGEAPGEEEQLVQVPFVGPSGKLLNQILASTAADPGMKQTLREFSTGRRRTKADDEVFHQAVFQWRNQHFYFTNAVACRPPDNRQPLPGEIQCCWERLWNLIYIVDPLVIVALGGSALAAVTRRKGSKITKERGNIYDVEFDGMFGKLTYPVIPMFHPAYLLRKADFKTPGGDWSTTLLDWSKAIAATDKLAEIYYGTPRPDRTPYF